MKRPFKDSRPVSDMKRPFKQFRPIGPFSSDVFRGESTEPVQCDSVEIERLETSDEFNYDLKCLNQAGGRKAVFKVDSFNINEDYPAAFGSTPSASGVKFEIRSTTGSESISVVESTEGNVSIKL